MFSNGPSAVHGSLVSLRIVRGDARAPRALAPLTFQKLFMQYVGHATMFLEKNDRKYINKIAKISPENRAAIWLHFLGGSFRYCTVRAEHYQTVIA